jgi:negative regulator of flagellin synthesis FlgM
MDIRDVTANTIARTYTRQAGATSSTGNVTPLSSQKGGRSRTDSVTLSPATQELKRLRDAAADHPEIRSQRVAVLKSAIDAGTYQVDTIALAQKMLSFA